MKKTMKRTTMRFLALNVLVFSVLALVVFVAPHVTHAQIDATPSTGPTQAVYDGAYCTTPVTTFSTLADVFKFGTCFLQRLLLPLFFVLAGLCFVWGTVKFIAAKDSSEKEEGQQFMLWGVIAFAVMLSLWGLIRLFNTTFHLGTSLPTIPKTSQIQ